MNKSYLNFIVRLSSIAFVLITFFTIINIKDDIVWKVFCVGTLIISVYLLLCALIVNFTVFEDRIVLHKPFKTINIYWKEIGLISAVEYRKNNYNFYLSPRKEVKESNFNKSILINWQFNNHKELVKIILAHCEKDTNTYIDKNVYKAIEC